MKIAYLFALIAFSLTLFSQELKLDVEGNTRIIGHLDVIRNATDTSSLYIGRRAGANTIIGATNTFVGTNSGRESTTSFNNSFFGELSGMKNLTGRQNTFIGRAAGWQNKTGGDNSFFGHTAGERNITGTKNTFIGTSANYTIGLDSLDRAIAIGYKAEVGCNNCAIIGGIGDDEVNLGIGLSSPLWRMTVKEIGNAIVGSNVDVSNLALVLAKESDTNNQAIGMGFQSSSNPGSVGAAIIHEREGSTSLGKLHFATKLSSGLGANIPIRMTLDNAGRLGLGVTSPSFPLELSNGAHCTVAGVWMDASDLSKKDNITSLHYGLSEILQLNPKSYNYKIDHSKSIGFIAQEMEKVIPEIVSGEEGHMGISYGQLTAVLVNAIKEQQVLIERQQMQIDEMKALMIASKILRAGE